MKIGICDDEKAFRDLLARYCKNCSTYVEESYGEITVETFGSGEEILDAYRRNASFDIVFLDLKMRILNGFETARQIRSFDNRVIIIFITSLAQYVMQSFEYKPFWYLIKPISEANFRNVFFKAFSEFSSSNRYEYTFKTREEGIEKINIGNIIYLESLTRQIRLHAVDNDYYFYAGISKEEKKLAQFEFIRIHKSYIVNPLFIKRINKTNLTLKDGETLPVSERRLKAVYDYFTDFLARSTL